MAFRCPDCGGETHAIDTRRRANGTVYRRLACAAVSDALFDEGNIGRDTGADRRVGACTPRAASAKV